MKIRLRKINLGVLQRWFVNCCFLPGIGKDFAINSVTV